MNLTAKEQVFLDKLLMKNTLLSAAKNLAKEYWQKQQFFIQGEKYQEHVKEIINSHPRQDPLIADLGGTGKWLDGYKIFTIDYRTGEDIDDLSDIIINRQVKNLDIVLLEQVIQEPMNLEKLFFTINNNQTKGSIIYLRFISPYGEKQDEKIDITRLGEVLSKRYPVNRPTIKRVTKLLGKDYKIIEIKTETIINQVPYKNAEQGIKRFKQTPFFKPTIKLLEVIRDQYLKINQESPNGLFTNELLKFYNGELELLNLPGIINEITAIKL